MSRKTSFKVEHLPQLGGSDANFPTVCAWVEMVKAGHGYAPVCPWNWDDRVAVIRDKDKAIVSLLVWRPAKWAGEAIIVIGWTDPRARKCGLYTKLYKAVSQQAREMGLRRITGYVMPQNETIHEVAVSLGRIKTGEEWSEDL